MRLDNRCAVPGRLTRLPPDGYYGRTIGLALDNYYAEVTLTPAETVSFEAHPEGDADTFADLDSLACACACRPLPAAACSDASGVLAVRVQRNGFYGGIRLLWSICVQFREFHEDAGRKLPKRGFRLSYSSNIPKQAGLSGSSAIVTAALSCLETYFGEEFVVAPLAVRPGVALAAESALGITAGLQDRVCQSYNGLVYMDFEEKNLKAKGHGEYTRLDVSLLPPLYLIFCDNPGDSGAVHSSVRKRWEAGEPEVRRLISAVADLPPRGLAALEAGDKRAFAALMDENFAIRRQLFGDDVVGATNIAMVDVCKSVGASAKFSGSGGAVVALCPNGEAQEKALADACAAAGLRCELVRVHLP